MNLYETVREAMSLPSYVDKLAAVRAVIEQWRKKNPLVDEVLQGHVTFAAQVKSIVEENRKVQLGGLRCSAYRASRTQSEGGQAKTSLDDIFNLEAYVPGTRISYSVSLLEPSKMSWDGWWIVMTAFTLPSIFFGVTLGQNLGRACPALLSLPIFGLICVTFAMLLNYSNMNCARRERADALLQEAQWLDQMLQDAYAGHSTPN